MTTETSLPASWMTTVPSDLPSFQTLSVQVNVSRTSRDNFRDWMAAHLDPAQDSRKLGLGLAAAGDFPAALPHLEQQKDDLCRLLAGKARAAAGERGKAQQIFASLSGSPAVGVASQLELLELLLREHDDQAMEAPMAALSAARPSAADMAYAQGLLAEARGDHEQAMASWRQALQADPRHGGALFRLAYRVDLDGDDDEAVTLYESFLSGAVAPQAGALINLGVLYEDRENYAAAARIYQVVLDADPSNRRARRYVTDALASTQQYYDESRERRADKQNAVLRIPVTDFELSVRARNCLQRMNIHSLGDLVCRTESELLSFKNFGETSLAEVKDILTMKGLRLGMFPPPDRLGGALLPPLPEAEIDEEVADVRDTPIGSLDLSVRSRAALATLGIATVGELADTSESTLLSCRNFGQTSLDEVKSKLAELGLSLSDA